MKLILIVLTLLSSLYNPFLFAETGRFQYKVDYVPATDATSCQKAAFDIAKRFTDLTQRSIVSAICEKTIAGTWDVIITYAGDYELNLVSTKEFFMSDQGLYRTIEECEANKGPETQKFRQNTDLEPVVAYCYAPFRDRAIYPHPYAIRIDAFGKPKMWPTVMDWSFFDYPYVNQEAMGSFVRDRALSFNVVNPQAVFDHTFASYRLMLSYYSPTRMPLPISMKQVTTYQTLAECQGRQNEVYQTLKTAGADSLVLFCAFNEYSRLYPMRFLSYTTGVYGSEMVGGTYTTMASCDQDKERVKRIYQETFGRSVTGALCSSQYGETASGRGIYMRVFYSL